jgi:hypothetical protein
LLHPGGESLPWAGADYAIRRSQLHLAHHRPCKESIVSKTRNTNLSAEPTSGISTVRTAIAAGLSVVGIAWLAVYIAVGDEGHKLLWMYDLADWNFLIAFGLFFLGLMVASNPKTPLGRGRGIVVGMLGSFLLGLTWIVIYYVTGNTQDVPVIRDLGQYNLLVGVGCMAVGFVYATKWE